MTQDPYKIFIVAGEASGDTLGAKLMQELTSKRPGTIKFFGVGGPKMQEAGLDSLFPMAELSLMGFVEIFPHIPRLLKRITFTAQQVQILKPDLVITIDSPGFCFRLAKKLQGSGIKLLHYVAPSVWAYREGRAKKLAKLYDHLLTLLPFEAKYFEKEGLSCSFVGHPIVEDYKFKGNNLSFRAKHAIAPENTILCVMPGSRLGELDCILPVFISTIKLLMDKIPSLSVVVISLPHLAPIIKEKMGYNHLKVIITTDEEGKKGALAAANIALVKSGTSSLEVALSGVPMVVAYKVHPISAFIIKKLIKIKYVSLVNIIKNQQIIPEFLQESCDAELIAGALERLVNDGFAKAEQLQRAKEALLQIGYNAHPSPSHKAAEAVLRIIEERS